MKKIIKITKALDAVLSILRIILIVASVIAALTSFIAIFSSDSVLESDARLGLSFMNGSIKIQLHEPEAIFSAGDIRTLFILRAVAYAVAFAAAFYAIHLFKSILGEMKEGRIFYPRIPTCIRRIAYMIFAYGIASPVFLFVYSYLIVKTFNLRELLTASPLVKSLGIYINLDNCIFAVFIGFTILMLSFVFDYGVKLQQESDEIL